MTALALALTLRWTSPACTQGSTLCAPAGCVESAVIYVHRKAGPRWWEQATIADTVRIATSDSRPMAFLTPLWWDYGTAFVLSRDAAGNWSPQSRYVESRKP